uniref:Uncharacterized protein n=1 Tax=Trypanosoma vivax (strain Y486) TaxID=1055687 RepID=G0U5E2_TRYVY|nr:conserved hypothetical protein, fragment [Trypanosoma vivax Y486]
MDNETRQAYMSRGRELMEACLPATRSLTPEETERLRKRGQELLIELLQRQKQHQPLLQPLTKQDGDLEAHYLARTSSVESSACGATNAITTSVGSSISAKPLSHEEQQCYELLQASAYIQANTGVSTISSKDVSLVHDVNSEIHPVNKCSEREEEQEEDKIKQNLLASKDIDTKEFNTSRLEESKSYEPNVENNQEHHREEEENKFTIEQDIQKEHHDEQQQIQEDQVQAQVVNNRLKTELQQKQKEIQTLTQEIKVQRIVLQQLKEENQELHKINSTLQKEIQQQRRQYQELQEQTRKRKQCEYIDKHTENQENKKEKYEKQQEKMRQELEEERAALEADFAERVAALEADLAAAAAERDEAVARVREADAREAGFGADACEDADLRAANAMLMEEVRELREQREALLATVTQEASERIAEHDELLRQKLEEERAALEADFAERVRALEAGAAGQQQQQQQQQYGSAQGANPFASLPGPAGRLTRVRTKPGLARIRLAHSRNGLVTLRRRRCQVSFQRRYALLKRPDALLRICGRQHGTAQCLVGVILHTAAARRTKQPPRWSGERGKWVRPLRAAVLLLLLLLLLSRRSCFQRTHALREISLQRSPLLLKLLPQQLVVLRNALRRLLRDGRQKCLALLAQFPHLFHQHRVGRAQVRVLTRVRTKPGLARIRLAHSRNGLVTLRRRRRQVSFQRRYALLKRPDALLRICGRQHGTAQCLVGVILHTAAARRTKQPPRWSGERGKWVRRLRAAVLLLLLLSRRSCFQRTHALLKRPDALLRICGRQHGTAQCLVGVILHTAAARRTKQPPRWSGERGKWVRRLRAAVLLLLLLSRRSCFQRTHALREISLQRSPLLLKLLPQQLVVLRNALRRLLRDGRQKCLALLAQFPHLFHQHRVGRAQVRVLTRVRTKPGLARIRLAHSRNGLVTLRRRRRQVSFQRRYALLKRPDALLRICGRQHGTAQCLVGVILHTAAARRTKQPPRWSGERGKWVRRLRAAVLLLLLLSRRSCFQRTHALREISLQRSPLLLKLLPQQLVVLRNALRRLLRDGRQKCLALLAQFPHLFHQHRVGRAQVRVLTRVRTKPGLARIRLAHSRNGLVTLRRRRRQVSFQRRYALLKRPDALLRICGRQHGTAQCLVGVILHTAAARRTKQPPRWSGERGKWVRPLRAAVLLLLLLLLLSRRSCFQRTHALREISLQRSPLLLKLLPQQLVVLRNALRRLLRDGRQKCLALLAQFPHLFHQHRVGRAQVRVLTRVRTKPGLARIRLAHIRLAHSRNGLVTLRRRRRQVSFQRRYALLKRPDALLRICGRQHGTAQCLVGVILHTAAARRTKQPPRWSGERGKWVRRLRAAVLLLLLLLLLSRRSCFQRTHALREISLQRSPLLLKLLPQQLVVLRNALRRLLRDGRQKCLALLAQFPHLFHQHRVGRAQVRVLTRVRTKPGLARIRLAHSRNGLVTLRRRPPQVSFQRRYALLKRPDALLRICGRQHGVREADAREAGFGADPCEDADLRAANAMLMEEVRELREQREALLATVTQEASERIAEHDELLRQKLIEREMSYANIFESFISYLSFEVAYVDDLSRWKYFYYNLCLGFYLLKRDLNFVSIAKLLHTEVAIFDVVHDNGCADLRTFNADCSVRSSCAVGPSFTSSPALAPLRGDVVDVLSSRDSPCSFVVKNAVGPSMCVESNDVPVNDGVVVPVSFSASFSSLNDVSSGVVDNRFPVEPSELIRDLSEVRGIADVLSVITNDLKRLNQVADDFTVTVSSDAVIALPMLRDGARDYCCSVGDGVVARASSPCDVAGVLIAVCQSILNELIMLKKDFYFFVADRSELLSGSLSPNHSCADMSMGKMSMLNPARPDAVDMSNSSMLFCLPSQLLADSVLFEKLLTIPTLVGDLVSASTSLSVDFLSHLVATQHKLLMHCDVVERSASEAIVEGERQCAEFSLILENMQVERQELLRQIACMQEEAIASRAITEAAKLELQQTNDNRRVSLRVMQEELASAKRDVEALQLERCAALHRIELLKSENANLSSLFEEIKKTAEDVETEQQREVARLQEALREKARLSREMLQSTEEQIAKAVEQAERSGLQREQAEKQARSVQSTLDRVLPRLEQLEEERCSLEGKLMDTSQRLNELVQCSRTAEEVSRRRVESLSSRVEELTKANSTLRENSAAQQDLVDSLRVKLDESESELARLRARMAQQDGEAQRLRGQLSDLESLHARQAEDSSVALHACELRIVSLESRNATLKEELQQQQQQYCTLRERCDDVEQKLWKASESHQTMEQQQKRRVQQLTERTEALHKEHKQLLEAYTSLMAERDAIAREHASDQQSMKRSGRRLERVNQQNEQLKAELQRQRESHEAEMHAARIALDGAHGELVKWRASLEDAEKSKGLMRDAMQVLQQEKAVYEEEVKVLRLVLRDYERASVVDGVIVSESLTRSAVVAGGVPYHQRPNPTGSSGAETLPTTQTLSLLTLTQELERLRTQAAVDRETISRLESAGLGKAVPCVATGGDSVGVTDPPSPVHAAPVSGTPPMQEEERAVQLSKESGDGQVGPNTTLISSANMALGAAPATLSSEVAPSVYGKESDLFSGRDGDDDGAGDSSGSIRSSDVA